MLLLGLEPLHFKPFESPTAFGTPGRRDRDQSRPQQRSGWANSVHNQAYLDPINLNQWTGPNSGGARSGLHRTSIIIMTTRIRLLHHGLLLLLVLLSLQPAWGFVPSVSRRTRSALSSTASAQPAPPDVAYRAPAEVPVWQVPPAIRREVQEDTPPAKRIEFLSLEALFPGPDGRRLAEAFDNDGRFRCVTAPSIRGYSGSC